MGRWLASWASLTRSRTLFSLRSNRHVSANVVSGMLMRQLVQNGSASASARLMHVLDLTHSKVTHIVTQCVTPIYWCNELHVVLQHCCNALHTQHVLQRVLHTL